MTCRGEADLLDCGHAVVRVHTRLMAAHDARPGSAGSPSRSMPRRWPRLAPREPDLPKACLDGRVGISSCWSTNGARWPSAPQSATSRALVPARTRPEAGRRLSRPAPPVRPGPSLDPASQDARGHRCRIGRGLPPTLTFGCCSRRGVHPRVRAWPQVVPEPRWRCTGSILSRPPQFVVVTSRHEAATVSASFLRDPAAPRRPPH